MNWGDAARLMSAVPPEAAEARTSSEVRDGHSETRAVAATLLSEKPFRQETSALRQRAWQSTMWQGSRENAYEDFQSVQADGFAGEQFIRVSNAIS